MNDSQEQERVGVYIRNYHRLVICFKFHGDYVTGYVSDPKSTDPDVFEVVIGPYSVGKLLYLHNQLIDRCRVMPHL